jgi:hypothetical protein
MKNQSNNFTYTNEIQVAVPKQTAASFIINEQDWSRVYRLIEKFSEEIRWLEILLSIMLSSFVSFAIAFFSAEEGQKFLIYSMLITGTASLCLFIFFLILKKNDGINKQRILDEMKELCYVESASPIAIQETDSPSAPYVIDIWKATKSDLPQGMRFYKLDLNNALITTLKFKIVTSSQYWRAGIKLASLNTNADSLVLTNKSFVLNLQKNVDTTSVGVDIYLNGNIESAAHNTLPSSVNTNKELIFTLERTDNNSMNCYVNDELVYSGRIKKEFLKNIYLCTWGDEYEYEIDFKGIRYTTGSL